MMGKLSQRIGAEGEEIADYRLVALGFRMIEKIGTPVRLVPSRVDKNAYRVIYGEKVSGDRRAIIPGSGKSVLIETKTILGRNLRWSDLRDHQPERLSEHALHGGISLLVWVHDTGVYVMRWPVRGFGERKSISPERAEILALTGLPE